MFKLFLFIPFLVFAQNLPLTTCGRYVVDNEGIRFKMSSVNWYGAHEKKHVVGGLDVKPLREIVRTIKNAGFNSVRLTFSNEMLETKKVDPKFLTANPELVGKTPLEIFDLTVEALAKENIIIVLNNHISASGWCCLFEEDGLWYTRKYSERKWINDWEFLVKRYAHIPQVAAVDLRNEIRIAKWRGTFIPNPPFWGTNSKNDWRRAAQEAGNSVLKINPNLLVIVEGINFPRYHLRGVWKKPVQLIRPSQLVYSVHNYSFTKPKLITGPTYGEMSWESFKKIMDEEWGFVLDLEIGKQAPVWVSEFGASAKDDQKWFNNIIRYLKEKDTDFAYWPLNSGNTFEGTPEQYSILEQDWSGPVSDWRWPLIQQIQRPIKGWTSEDSSKCKSQPYRVLAFDQNDAFEEPWILEWSKGEYKGTCGKKSRAVGISIGGKRKGPIKSLLCSREAQNFNDNGFILVKSGDVKFNNIRTKLDWSLGNDKIECPRDSFVKGIAQSGRVVKGILCSYVSPNIIGTKCVEKSIDQELPRLKLPPGDWQVGYKKITCEVNEHLAGISLKKGIPVSLLCCH